MFALFKSWAFWLVVAVAAVVLGVWAWLEFRIPPDLRALRPLRGEWMALAGEGSKEERGDLAARSLEMARKYPGTGGGIAALLLAATRGHDTEAGKEAQGELAGEVREADLDELAKAFDRALGHLNQLRPLAPALLERVRAEPDHPKAGRLLAAVCTMAHPGEDGVPPAVYVEAANLIAERYADSPGLTWFCEGLGGSGAGSPSWGGPYERHLRAILKVNETREVRCVASFALACVVQSSPEDRQAEAAELFAEFRSEFDGQHSYRYQGIEQQLHQLAGQLREELLHRAVGMPAQETAGLGLDGKALALSEVRGKAVLLSFWATWCFPCMKLVPHERALLEKFRGRPFEIVGVNADQDVEKAVAAVAKSGMTWRSLRNEREGKPSVSKEWGVLGYPTLYLIDHHGIIRRRWVGAPAPAELEIAVSVLVEAAERKLPGDKIQTELRKRLVPATGGAKKPDGPAGKFVERVYRDGGKESKYSVFVPGTHDGKQALPALLYLHGAGPRGDDGKRHLKHGLAKFIRENGDVFPFLVVFPQAREGENWTAGSPGGRRALAILDEALTQYGADRRRVILSGHSMGGEGTWSLAAAHPERWAAIAPMAGGGDVRTAARLKGVPCWCLHGEEDRTIPPRLSRQMISAIEEAGGRPLYQELPGVGHDDCPIAAFAVPGLVEWLLLQRTPGQ